MSSEMSSGCRARVPDHTDYVDCGAKVVRAERCLLHIHAEITELQAECRQLRIEIQERQRRIDELVGMPPAR